MTGFEEFLVHFNRHKRTIGRSQIVSKFNNIHYITNGFNGLFKTLHMAFHQGIQKSMDAGWISQQIHQKIIHSPDHGTPFK